MRYRNATSWFLAIAMLMFGMLKFVDPFKGWYAVQIVESNLGQLSYVVGIAGEISVGIILFLCLTYRSRISAGMFNLVTNTAFFTIMAIMLAGAYVHLHPNVPADVLPLKVKPPYIPMFFLLLALSNIVISTGNSNKHHRPRSA